ncbi:MAG: hypothetical protein MI741_03700 [Rhodospirillales bacterium]|nr:hypothetical protein [Rhodospirillales bacterium]
MPDAAFDAETTHQRFIDIAEDLSPQLAADMRYVGPVEFPDRRGMGLCKFLARAVVGQQISTKAAASIWGRFEELLASEKAIPERFLTTCKTEQLRACGLSGSKTKTLIAIGEALSDGLDDETLDALTTKERDQKLLSIWGVGQWTCDMASIFYFGDLDIWPDGDIAVIKTFKRYLGRKKPNIQARRFAPERSVLALYMWQIINRMPDGTPSGPPPNEPYRPLRS